MLGKISDLQVLSADLFAGFLKSLLENLVAQQHI